MSSLFNLTPQMQQIGQLFVTELKNRMTRQIGVDGTTYAPLKPATIKQKMKVAASTATKRMIRTKDFLLNAYRSQASKDNVRVFVGTEPHGRALRTVKTSLRAGKIKNVTKAHATIKGLSAKAVNMNDLARYQLEAGGANFFPQSDTEVEKMDSFKRAMQLLDEEAYKQALNKMKFKMNVSLNIG